MDIDLNLNNYTISDLQRFFDVTGDYTIHDVEQKKQFLITRLNAMNVSLPMQNEIITFLNNAKEKLLNNSELIPKQITPFVYSNPSDHFKGTFNTIEKKMVSKLICVDTFFRSSYLTTKSTDFTYTFPETINNVVSMQLSCLEIPYTWYNISAEQKNNFFIIIYDNTSTTITIPDGNYNLADVITAINNILPDGYSIVNNTDLMPNKICQTYSPPQTYITILGSASFSLDFSTNGSISLGWLLGFRHNINSDGTYYYSGSTNYSSETMPMMTTNNYLFVDVDDFHNHHSTDSVISIVRNQQSTPSYIGNNIMARIPIIGDYGAVITTNHNIDMSQKKREYFGPIKLEKMNIRILNRFGEVINLNQNDYSIVFEITQIHS